MAEVMLVNRVVGFLAAAAPAALVVDCLVVVDKKNQVVAFLEAIRQSLQEEVYLALETNHSKEGAFLVVAVLHQLLEVSLEIMLISKDPAHLVAT